MQYVYALNPVCIVLIIPDTPAGKFPVRAVDIVNPGNTMTIHRTWHTLININNIWNFNSLFRFVNFLHIRFCELQKASGITPWKKCYSLLRWPCLLQDVLNRRLLFKQTGSSSTKTITHHFFVSGIGRRKLSMQPKFVAAQRMLLNRNPTRNIRKWIARFYYFRHLYSAGSACVLLTIIAWVAHRYGQLYLHCSLIYFWVPSSCFAVISLSLRVK